MITKKQPYTTLASPILLLLFSALTACNDSTSTVQLDEELRKLVNSEGLTGNAMKERTIPDVSSKTVQLGMRLFYSKSLGGDQDSACVSCHHPVLGGGDALSLSIGVEAQDPDLLGVGRLHSSTGTHSDGGPTVPRNAPTTFNLAAWDEVLFHDGRVESLAKTDHENGAGTEGIRTPDSTVSTADLSGGLNLAHAQARFPVTSPEEMKGFNHNGKNNQQIRDFLAQRLGGYGAGTGLLSNTAYWLDKFRDTFNSPTGTAEELITEQRISFLLGEYERSQVFIDTPWKSYVEGNNSAISESAKRGGTLFFTPIAEGGADCSSCHSGDFFTDENFHNIATPQIGRGKGDGATGDEDFGRFRETKRAEDMFAFRTPTLLNVEVTGPWTHAGAYTTLEAMVRHSLNHQKALTNYDTNQLNQVGIQSLSKIQAHTQKAIDASNFEGSELNLSDTQVTDIVEFLKTLTDPCVKDRQCLSAWILDSTDTDADPNNEQLIAKDVNGVDL